MKKIDVLVMASLICIFCIERIHVVTSKLFLKMIFDPQDVELKRLFFFKLLLISKMYKNKGFRFLKIFLVIFGYFST